MKEELEICVRSLVSFNELYADMIKKGFPRTRKFYFKRYLFG